MSGFLLMTNRDIDEVMDLLRVERDPESFDRIEAMLYEAVLEAIAGGWANPAILAQRALEAKRIKERSRWKRWVDAMVNRPESLRKAREHAPAKTLKRNPPKAAE